MKHTSASRLIALFGLLLSVATAACSYLPQPATTTNDGRTILTRQGGGSGPPAMRWGPKNATAEGVADCAPWCF